MEKLAVQMELPSRTVEAESALPEGDLTLRLLSVEELVEEAKKRGIKVLMDLVVNHCSNEHEWFKAAVKDPESKYASYFIIEETAGKEPNNMRCYNATSAWERIRDSNRFYFHSFSKVHVTDYSNAARTMLFNINTLEWDDEILAEKRNCRIPD